MELEEALNLVKKTGGYGILTIESQRIDYGDWHYWGDEKWDIRVTDMILGKNAVSENKPSQGIKTHRSNISHER